MRIVLLPFTSSLLNKLDTRFQSYWGKKGFGAGALSWKEGMNPHSHLTHAVYQIIRSLTLLLSSFQRLLMQSGVLLSLDDPLENIQLQKAQQNLKSPANTQRSKGQLREFDENKMSQPVTLG